MGSAGIRLAKHLRLIMAVVFVVVITASLARSQEEEALEGIMDLKSKGFSQHHQPSVKFDHYLHETILRCSLPPRFQCVFQQELRQRKQMRQLS